MWTETELPASWPSVSKDFLVQEVEWAYLLPFLHLATCSLEHHPNSQACLSSLGLLPTPAPDECAAGAGYLILPGNPVCAPNSTRSHQQPPVWLPTSSAGSCLRAGEKCSPHPWPACRQLWEWVCFKGPPGILDSDAEARLELSVAQKEPRG